MILLLNLSTKFQHRLLGVWEAGSLKLIISGISGLALHWYVSGESLGWYYFGLHVNGVCSCRTSSSNFGPFREGEGGYWLSKEARSLACVCERKGKESKDILCFGIVVHQPAWYKRSFGVFNKARKGAALDIRMYGIAPVLYEYG